jgi:pimeloyl-ACP methyl ester carboxylesterase
MRLAGYCILRSGVVKNVKINANGGTNMDRREVLCAAITAGALAATSERAVAQNASTPGKPAFVLVHGSWHGAWCYSKVIPHLINAGHVVVAKDLPGHGLDAKFPKSYDARPLDAAAFATELSPLAGVKLDDYVRSVVATIDDLTAAGSGPVILLGHSMGGLPITAVGEAIPDKIRKLVYLTAFMPASGVPGGAYSRTPENAGAKAGIPIKGNPSKIGVLRYDTRSSDADYAASLKAAFAADISDEEWTAMSHFLTPDDPAAPFGAPINTTVGRWGKVSRAYIHCTEDYAIRYLLQQKYVALADAFVPNNKTETVTLKSSHSPFMSMPTELAAVLLKLAS